MEKKISFIIFKLIYLIDKLVQLTFKRSFLIWFPDFISHYKKIKFFNFFVPNKLIKFRVNTFYSKEPETLEWIDSFEKESCFWDIGANIGLYSVYCGVKKNAEIFFTNPNNIVLKFAIDEKQFKVTKNGLLKVALFKKDLIKISKSNSLFIRPTIFNYNNGFIDVYHS